MTINVRVVAGQALAKMQALRAGVAAVDQGVAKANRTEPLGHRHIMALSKFGNQLQWTGRMLQYNFTLPIIIAGAAATKFALDNEKAMTHVAKVYGDTAAAANYFQKQNENLTQQMAEQKATKVFTAELESLGQAFEAISNHYGVQQKEVLEVAGAWAAAGASGRALAESVDSTMQAIIIGDMEAGKATESLIAIQAQFNLSSQELRDTLATLNTIENTTGISMAGLIDGFARAAGQARTAGVDVNEHGAMLAGLVPATGSASAAGNALKTIFSRLMAPTKEAVQVMKAMGLETTAMSWQSATAAERLKIMAKEFDGLDASQKNVASSVIASRWQINKFSVLMKELTSDTGYYAKALDAAANPTENLARMQKELNTVLESDPRRLQRMWVMLQNASADVIQPLIPYIIYLAQSAASLAKSFSELDPAIQHVVLTMLVLLAAVGPIVKYSGALITLYAVLATGVQKLAISFIFLGRSMLAIPLKAISGLWWAFSTSVGAASGVLLKILNVNYFKMIGAVIFWSKTSLGYWMTTFATKLTLAKVFWLKMQVLWTAGALANVGVWARMWMMLKALTLTGMATQFAWFRKAMGLVAMWRYIGTTIVSIWVATWARVVAISVATAGVLKTVWMAQARAGAGIFILLRGALINIWTGTMMAGRAIWAAMSASMVAISWATAGGVKAAFVSLSKFMIKAARFMFGPWGLAIMALIGLFYAFQDELKQILNNIVTYFAGAGGSVGDIFDDLGGLIMDVFHMLPEGVYNSMRAVVEIVRAAALAVYDWFQYINPFAHHSPSLVENVEGGMARVVGAFSSLSKIKQYTDAAYKEVQKFGKITASLGISARAAQAAEDRATLKKSGNSAAIGSYNRLQQILNKLTPVLTRLEAAMNKQQRVVDTWAAKVDKANDALDRQQKKLDDLQDTLSKYEQHLSDAKDALDYYASAPLEGMREMEEQIFANQMAQTNLRWEMMKLEDVVGTYDELKSKIEAINGATELLRGEQSALRAAGAGSDILRQYDSEIAKLEEQQDTYKSAADQLAEMQHQLELLQREAEKLDLVKAMKFDQLQHQIEMAANQMQEMSFEDIMAGIGQAQADIAKWSSKVNDASSAVDKQQKVVDRLTAARDRLQQRLDKEQATLDRIKSRYDNVNNAIQAINGAISDVIGNAEKMNNALAGKGKNGTGKGKKAGGSYISPGLQNFLDAKGGNFPDPGGTGMEGRSDWSSQVGDIDAFTKDLEQQTASMFASLNPFAQIKPKLAAAWEWMKQKTKETWDWIVNFIGHAFDGVSFGDNKNLQNFLSGLEGAGEFITGVLKSILKVVKWTWDLLKPDLENIWNALVDGFNYAVDELGPVIKSFGPLMKPMGKAIKELWKVLKPVLAVIAGAVLLMVKIVASILGHVLEPAFKMIVDVIKGVLKIVRGVLKVITGLINADFGMFVDGITDIFSGLWDIIWGIFKRGVQMVVGVVWGFVGAIIGFFKWLWNELVGHSIVPDIINGIIFWFGKLGDLAKWVWNHVLKPVYLKFKSIWNDYIKPFVKNWWAGFKATLSAMKNAGLWFWNNILKPVYTKAKYLWTVVKEAFKLWWAGIKAVWNILKTLATWVWNNILKPVLTKVKNLWTDVKGQLRDWYANIKTVWNSLKNIGTWFKHNVMDPILSAVKAGWRGVKDWLVENKNMLVSPMKSVINTVIDGINALIKGLNKISDVLPGVDWEIKLVPKFEAGGQLPGRRVGAGFKTNGARAIVGEGNPNHPEYVIPTDPTYRKRARDLLVQAANKLGASDAPAFASGGILPDNAGGIWSTTKGAVKGAVSGTIKGIKSVGDYLADKGKDALKILMKPFIATANHYMDKVDWTVARDLGKFGIREVSTWTDGAAEAFEAKEKALAPKGLGYVSKSGWTRPLKRGTYTRGEPPSWKGGYAGHTGQDFPSAKGNLVYAPHAGTVSFRTFPGSNPYNSTPYRSYGKLAVLTGGGVQAYMAHLDSFVGSEGKVGPGTPIGRVGMNGNATGPHLHYEIRGAHGLMDPMAFMASVGVPMSKGGIALKRMGGTLIRAGEGLTDEAIVPLPSDWRNGKPGGGSTTNNFYGDLVFPNVTTADDAEAFLKNLENLGGE